MSKSAPEPGPGPATSGNPPRKNPSLAKSMPGASRKMSTSSASSLSSVSSSPPSTASTATPKTRSASAATGSTTITATKTVSASKPKPKAKARTLTGTTTPRGGERMTFELDDVLRKYSPEQFKTCKAYDVGGVNILNKKAVDSKTALDKIRRRRETHNRVERRRRDCINQLIDELTALLPRDDGDSKCHRVNVLRTAVTHIQNLTVLNEALHHQLESVKADPSSSSSSSSSAAVAASAVAGPLMQATRPLHPPPPPAIITTLAPKTEHSYSDHYHSCLSDATTPTTTGTSPALSWSSYAPRSPISPFPSVGMLSGDGSRSTSPLPSPLFTTGDISLQLPSLPMIIEPGESVHMGQDRFSLYSGEAQARDSEGNSRSAFGSLSGYSASAVSPESDSATTIQTVTPEELSGSASPTAIAGTASVGLHAKRMNRQTLPRLQLEPPPFHDRRGPSHRSNHNISPSPSPSPSSLSSLYYYPSSSSTSPHHPYYSPSQPHPPYHQYGQDAYSGGHSSASSSWSGPWSSTSSTHGPFSASSGGTGQYQGYESGGQREGLLSANSGGGAGGLCARSPGYPPPSSFGQRPPSTYGPLSPSPSPQQPEQSSYSRLSAPPQSPNATHSYAYSHQQYPQLSEHHRSQYPPQHSDLHSPPPEQGREHGVLPQHRSDLDMEMKS